MPTKKNIGGRPRALTPKKIEMALEMRDAGFTLAQIAMALGVHEDTLYHNEPEWEQFRAKLNAIKWANEKAETAKVKKALLKNCIGGKVRVKHERTLADGSIVQLTDEQYIKPDTRAQMFYLTNKAADEFKNAPNNAPPINAQGAALKIIIDNGENSE